jgi:HSP20 family molecular chaperone IbpA
LLVSQKDGIKVTLLALQDGSDLIGEEYEYLCRGLKEQHHEFSIYIDWDNYDKSVDSALENGILSITVQKKAANTEGRISVKSRPKKEKVQVG